APFIATATSWVDESLTAVGRRRPGPLSERKVRFWAGVYDVPVTRPDGHGLRVVDRALFKLGNPQPAFEAELPQALARLVPGSTVPPWAIEHGRGWWLLPDAGRTREATETAWTECLELVARLQRACAPHQGKLSMVPLLESDTAVGHAVGAVETMAA